MPLTGLLFAVLKHGQAWRQDYFYTATLQKIGGLIDGRNINVVGLYQPAFFPQTTISGVKKCASEK